MELSYEINFELPCDAKRMYRLVTKTCREEGIACPSIILEQDLPLKFEILHLFDGSFHLYAVRTKLDPKRALRLITRELMSPKPEYYDYPKDAMVHNSVSDMAGLYTAASEFSYEAGMSCPQVVVLEKEPAISGFSFGPYYPHGEEGKATAVFLREAAEEEMKSTLLDALKEVQPRNSAF